ncbi:hypothetical protein VUR80DRAFT_1147 [Thermomyces stellatus]
MRTLWPGTPGVRKWWADSIRDDLLNKPFHSYIKIVDTESADAHGKPRLVAYAKWDMSTIEERGARLNSERWRVMGDRKRYYLDSLVTHPDYRRLGLGARLVKCGCDLADKYGVGLYVEARKAAAPLYAKYGFVDESDPGAAESSSMARRAQ